MRSVLNSGRGKIATTVFYTTGDEGYIRFSEFILRLRIFQGISYILRCYFRSIFDPSADIH